MTNYNAYEPFSVCFNMLKIKYRDYDESISSKKFLNPYDKVNVFINLESVFKNLSCITDLEKKIIIQRDFEKIMISNTLNLIAHYKRFFTNNTLIPKVYIYNTDFLSNKFTQFKYNEDYRSYYLLKYNENPKFVVLTDKLKKDILPQIKTYCEFIPDVYYIDAKNIEGSLVPLIIANLDKTRKNFIITEELYDTQYSDISSFMTHCIHRTHISNDIFVSVKDCLKNMCSKDKDEDEVKDIIDTYDNYNFYCSLLSIMGNKMRSIDGVTGYGILTFKKLIQEGILKNTIKKETTSPELIGNIFDDEDAKEEFVNNYYCSSVLEMYKELTSPEIDSIKNQLIDRIDKNSIVSLNNTAFYNYPIIIDGLFT